MVRIAPNELSFNTAQSWKDIYGTRKGHQTFLKSSFYDGASFADLAHSIVSERDPTVHAGMRKLLSPAFSDRALSQQESLIVGVIDEMIKQVGIESDGENSVDMTKWFNLLTFDIFGQLAFGESFGGVSSGKTHPWIAFLLDGLAQVSLLDCVQRYPLVAKVGLRVFSRQVTKLLEGARGHQKFSIDAVKRRLETRTEQKDFIGCLLSESHDKDLDLTVQLAPHASDLAYVVPPRPRITC